MADETTNVGGGAEGEIGSVWLKMGLKVDDLKQSLDEVKVAIQNGVDDKPVEDFNKATEKVEKTTEELKKTLEEVETAVEDSLDEKPVEEFNEEVKKTEKSADGLTDKFTNLAKAVLAAFAVKSVVEFFNECEDLIQVQQLAEQKLENAMVNRFNATRQEIQEIKDLASGLQDIGTIGDEVTLAGAAKLSSYVKSVDTLKKVLPSIQDIAVAKLGVEVGQDQFADMAKTIGESFVEGSLSPLKSLDIAISEETEASWKALTSEEERAAFFVNLINDTVGKMNGSLSDTLSLETQLNNTVGDIKENIGSLYQLFIVPIRSMVFSIAKDVNTALTSLTSLLGVQMVRAETATNNAASSAANYFKNITKQANEAKRAIMGFDVIQKLGLTTDESANAGLDPSILDSNGTITQAVKFEYEEGGFADRITTALKTIGQGIADYIGKKLGIAFDAETIEGFTSKLEALAKWISENPDEFEAFCDRILNIVKALGLLTIIFTVLQWLGQFAFALNNIGTLVSSVGAMIANPWILAGVVIAGLVAGFVALLWFLRDEIAECWKTLMDFLGNPMIYLEAIMDVCDAIIGYIFDFLANLFKGLWNWMVDVGKSIAEWWRGLWSDKQNVEVSVSESSSGGRRARNSESLSIEAKHAATGAFVSANTPTLTVVGDNRRQGEFVLTEEQFATAAKKHGGGGEESVAVLREILEAIKSQNLTAVFDMDTIARFVLSYARKQERATGKPAF